MAAECVALYARVSSDRQTTAGTIASQLAALRERITADGWTLAPTHEFVDDGYSGATLTRPALERLRDRAALGGLTRLYVLAPDRLARRYAHQVLLLEEFARAGLRVCFLHHPPGETPDEVLLTQIQGILAEYERAAIEERTRRGRRFAAQQGQVSVLAGAPYGYHYQRPTPSGPATYTVVPSEAAVIEQIFTWVGLERCSLAEVARRLNAAAVPTRSGKPWSRASLGGILSNPAYRGQAAFGKTRTLAGPPEGRPSRSRTATSRRTFRTRDVPPAEWLAIPVPALVTPDLWEAVQEQLQENAARARQGQREARNLLPGLVVCGRCGYACCGKWTTHPTDGSTGVGYYRCAGRDRDRWVAGQPCPTPAVRIDVLDAAIWEVVSGILRDPARLWTEYAARTAGTEHAPGPDYEQQRRHLQRSLDRLIDSYTDGLVTKDELRPRLEGLRTRLARVTEQAQQAAAAQAAAQQVVALQGEWESFAAAVGAQLTTAAAPLQRALIRALVKRVELDQEQVRVVVRIGPGPPTSRSLQYCLNLPECGMRNAG